MNQTGIESTGPKTFGTTKRTSFVDIRDDDIPGPGQHDCARVDKNTPAKWKFGKSTERDSFLEKYPRPNPSPNHYKPTHKQTQSFLPKYSIPKSEVENPAEFKDDDGSAGNYRPRSNFTKPHSPQFSFGYAQETDYRRAVPSPNTYRTQSVCLSSKSAFNSKQNFFTKTDRPLPFGEEAKYPGSTKYQIHSHDPMNATAHVFGSSQRPKVLNGPDSPGQYFNIGKSFEKARTKFTLRTKAKQLKNEKDLFPAPNAYNPIQLKSKKKIINLTGARSQLYNRDHIKYPDPQKHAANLEFSRTNRSQSFTKELRYQKQRNYNPGPGNYEASSMLVDIKGYMGRKLRSPSQFVTPGADHYFPNDAFNRTTPQRTISYQTNRTDFSRSVTKRIGPGDYESKKSKNVEMGKMSKADKFLSNKNKNPAPGYYQIPSSIGKLPKYYCGQKKMTSTGFSTHALISEEKRQIRLQRARQQQRRQEDQERKMRQQNQVGEENE